MGSDDGLELVPRLREAVLAVARSGRGSSEAEHIGGLYESLLGERDRRAASAHYTPVALGRRLVARTLEPLVRSLGPSPRSEAVLALRVCDAAAGSGALLVECCRFLGAHVVAAWHREGTTRDHEDAVVDAHRLVATRCLFGIDRDPVAIALARAALWLVAGGDGDPFAFSEDKLVRGDALVGLDRLQLEARHWLPGAPRAPTPYDPPRDEPQRARRALLGDLIVGAFFAHESRRARQRELVARLRAFEEARTMGSSVAHAALASWQREIRDAVPVHHWPLAFPCDADRGLDGLMHAFVGNPPFVDGKRVSSVLGHRYSDWITTVHACRKTADLSGHFVRRSFELLRASATLGMIATNSVSEGETRRVGLAHVVAHGGVLYDATRSMPWPGDAAVHVALLHCARGAAAAHTGAPVLDGREVERIRTSLTAGAERAEPKRLSSNVALSFHGYKPYGDGFQIGAAERDELVRRDPRNAERLRPYAGGTELNRNPELTTDRWVIHFGDLSLDEARRWPDLLRILEERVRPARSSADDGTDDGRRLRTFWWQFFRERPEMQRALRGFDTCLALARVSKHVVVQTPPADWVLDEDVIVFALSGWSPFAVLQSRFHETWARAHSSTFGEGLRYSSSRVFDTFPFPEPDPRATSPALEPLGRDLHEMRLSYQRAAHAGATTTYNRMHDPACDDARIAALREAHEALDRGVARAYGLDCVVPPFRACDAASRAAARAFTERVLDHLHALNAERSGAR